jgi:hypothetical protein
MFRVRILVNFMPHLHTFWTGGKVRRLLKDALPTIFPSLPKYYQAGVKT